MCVSLNSNDSLNMFSDDQGLLPSWKILIKVFLYILNVTFIVILKFKDGFHSTVFWVIKFYKDKNRRAKVNYSLCGMRVYMCDTRTGFFSFFLRASQTKKEKEKKRADK
jgi:phage-related protein